MENFIKKWDAILEEYAAKAERLDAEQRLRYNDWRDDMMAQFAAIGDWTEASWDEFTAKAEQKWHDMVMSNSEDSKES